MTLALYLSSLLLLANSTAGAQPLDLPSPAPTRKWTAPWVELPPLPSLTLRLPAPLPAPTAPSPYLLPSHPSLQGHIGPPVASFEAPRLQGGHQSLVLGSSQSFRTGPEVSWMTPDPPAEDMVETAVLMPSWAVWYSPNRFNWAIGVSTGMRVLATDYVSTEVDSLLSLAKLELHLP